MKTIRRQDLSFSEKDLPLKQDVHVLGALVGELLKDQGGDALFERVETARKLAIQRRDGDEQAGQALIELVSKLDHQTALEVVRAFSTYFQMVNTAEKVHRIRRRRIYLRDKNNFQPGGVEAALTNLKQKGLGFDELESLFKQMRIEPVFTAHPTEPTRRTILRKEQRIVRRLIDLLNPTLTEQEKAVCLANIRLEITTGWQTDETPSQQMTVADELEHVLFFVTDILYKAVPPFYEDIEKEVSNVYGEAHKAFRLPNILRFSSWVGGDMDGNPNVNAKTIRSTLERQRSLILDLYFNECKELSQKLSQSLSRTGFSPKLLSQIEHYRDLYQHAYHAVPARHREMPYRVFLRLIQARLQATYDDDAYPYESAEEFQRDIQFIADSLRGHRGTHAGLFAVNRLLRRIETFGFHFLTLDVRQDAMVLRQVVGELLEVDNWLEWKAEDRAQVIVDAIRSRDSITDKPSVTARKTLAVFQAIAYCQRKFGSKSIGPFIISMTEGADDILSVLLLANWSELHNRRDEVPLDVVPLLETVDDLQNGGEILKSLLDNELYREHLKQRDDSQMVMIGYSDSSKDSGLTASRWALRKAQIELCELASSRQIDLQLFHGRGGTISRGGSRTHTAVLNAPAGTVNGRLRVTEQGEIINEKYGLRGIALRSLEQVTGAVALATAIPDHQGPEQDEWHQITDVIARESRKRYRQIVYETEGFYDYFRLSTPIDLIERMRIGSRPASRRSGKGVENLRAIPWVFSWTQNRLMLPGWLGIGSGLAAARDQFGEEKLCAMFKDCHYAAALALDVEMVMAKSDIGIAERYSMLAGDLHEKFFPLLIEEFEQTRQLVLTFADHERLLESNSTLQRSIMLRNPYVDPMSLMQIDLLQRWRQTGHKDEKLFDILLASVNGIAQGLQNTG